ncbi:MAG: inner-rane translocator [Devosia sp.]|uniref:ABC transporter permease n=1 Tax=Devosia sp. TaxID=1871048 RepID=UPI00260FB3AB|nr:ABC transporter permease [Devosia sp.]MDB5531332.1 inner-rane translocator [Devosia sp.]
MSNQAPVADGLTRLGQRLTHPIAIIAIFTLLMLVVGQAMTPGFAQPSQLVSLLRIAAFLGFISAGQTLVILAGNEGIDLSVGSIVTVAAIIVFALNGTIGLSLAIVLALGAGALVGFLNGLGIAGLGLQPLMMTLGMAGVVKGAVLVVTGGRPTGTENQGLTAFVTQPWIAGVPGTVLLWLALGIALHIFLTRSPYGKSIYAYGANARAARLAGMRTRAISIATYTASGLLAAVGGVVLLGYTGSVFINLGEPYTLPSIAAVVIGGTLLSGGAGSYWGTMTGALMLTVLQSFLIMLGLPEFARQITYGALLVMVLAIYSRANE